MPEIDRGRRRAWRRPVALGCLLMLAFAAGSAVQASEPDWRQACFDEGKNVFFRQIRQLGPQDPRAQELTSGELERLGRIERLYPRLYGILLNVYYLKEEPVLEAWAADGRSEARSLFCSRLVELAGFAARQFVDALFVPGANPDWVRNLLLQFRGMDRIDLVVLSTGYRARLDAPPTRPEPAPLSPEYDRQWALAAGRYEAAHELSRGEGARVAVIDSGIDLDHPIFRGFEVRHPFALVGRDGPPWSAGIEQTDWGGHGTVVSSIVARFAPGAELTVYKCNDSETMNNAPYPLLLGHFMAACIYKAVHDGNAVINISAGIPLGLPYLAAACRYAWENNVLIVTGGPYSLAEYLGTAYAYPGSFETTLTVTGIERLDDGSLGLWPAAGSDPSIDLAAANAPFAASTTFSGDEDRYVPGISCATPIVAATAALVVSVYPRSGAEGPGEYVETVESILTETANSEVLGFTAWSPEVGYGLVDARAAVEAAIDRASGRRIVGRSRRSSP